MDVAVTNYAQTPLKTISGETFNNIRTVIFKVAGINLSDAKQALVVGRLNKRLRILKLLILIFSIKRYCPNIRCRQKIRGLKFGVPSALSKKRPTVSPSV
jgi:hypothetical protein